MNNKVKSITYILKIINKEDNKPVFIKYFTGMTDAFNTIEDFKVISNSLYGKTPSEELYEAHIVTNILYEDGKELDTYFDENYHLSSTPINWFEF